jgi:acetoacetyl-CoA synthetase
MSMSTETVTEGTLLWTPSAELVASSHMRRYMDWLREHRGLTFAGYEQLRIWSITDPSGFWGSLWEYFAVESSTPYASVLAGDSMIAARWFEGCRLNYAEHLLRHEARAGHDEVAILYASELQPLAGMTWRELGEQVRKVATHLRSVGIQPGDRVVSFMPNIPETIIAMIACVAIGAVWSAASPEFGSPTVVDRFAQIQPTLLFAVDGYTFGGRAFNRVVEVRKIVDALPTLKHVVWIDELQPGKLPDPSWRPWSELLAGEAIPPNAFKFFRGEWNHPLWIVFSSGTTGLPKAIVHGHAGMLLEHLKLVNLHFNLRPGARLFFYTTTGWMMWNIVVSSLLAGATAVLYDGNPTHPSPDLLWKIAAEAKVTHMGASPTFLGAMRSARLEPGRDYDLSALEMVTVSGSPCTPELFEWIYTAVKADVFVASQSGGTEICSAFVGAVPILPVYAGEIQERMLGMDVRVWNDAGQELSDEVGELVVTRAFPSMPLYFWDDPGNQRYLDAYFRAFRGVWRHGDFVKINSRGGCFVYGRSDSTLNRHGVRIGTAEIYRAMEKLPEVIDSLVVCCELDDGSFFMPLFVQLPRSAQLDDDLREMIRQQLRRDGSPRHVPDRIEQVEAIPYTLTRKKMEIPVRRILMGVPAERAASRDAMANPTALDPFVEFRRRFWPETATGSGVNAQAG